jgi:hypothetical protein
MYGLKKWLKGIAEATPHCAAMRMTVCHEGAQEDEVLPVQLCCIRDEGGPLETALQGEVSNHRKLQQLRVVVVSVTEKAEQDFVR